MAEIQPSDPVWMVMSSPAAWVDPEASLLDVAEKLLDEAIGLLVVLAPGGLVGVVSERDVVRALAVGGEPSELWAADLMAEQPVAAEPDDPIIDVADRMVDAGIRHVPVVADGELRGVVSMRDVLRVVADAWRRLPPSRPDDG